MELRTLTVDTDHADLLLEFARVATSPAGDVGDLARVSAELLDAKGAEFLVDAAAVVANFEMMTRLAEGTGSVLHNMASVRAGTEVGADVFKHH